MQQAVVLCCVAVLLGGVAASDNEECEPCQNTVHCCGGSTYQYQLACRLPPLNHFFTNTNYTVCDEGTDERLFETVRGEYKDELTNVGTMGDEWREQGHKRETNFALPFGSTKRMYAYTSQSNNEWIFRVWTRDSQYTVWPTGGAVFVFARLDDPPIVQYSIEEPVPGVKRLVVDLNRTTTSWFGILGGQHSAGYIRHGEQQYLFPVSRALENRTVFGQDPDLDPSHNREVWFAWLGGGEVADSNLTRRMVFSAAVEVHDPVAELIYIVGGAVLLAFVLTVLILAKFFPKTWVAIIAFFWDRGAPPPPPDMGEEQSEDESCDERDFLEKTPEELQAEQAEREAEEKEKEARRLRREQLKSGDRGTIEHSDEEDAEEFAEEMEEQSWAPSDIMERMKGVVARAKELVQYQGKSGMDEGSLFEHIGAFTEQIQVFFEGRRDAAAGTRRQQSRRAKTVQKDEVALNPEVEEARRKALELREAAAKKAEERRAAVMAAMTDVSEKASAFLQRMPLSRLPFAKKKKKDEKQEDNEDSEDNEVSEHDKRLLGEVVEQPFEDCVTELEEHVLPVFVSMRSLLEDLPDGPEISSISVPTLTASLREKAAEIEKTILYYIPTFCYNLNRELMALKEEREKLGLLDALDEEKQEPLDTLLEQVTNAKKTQQQIMMCIRGIQKLGKSKSRLYFSYKGRKLLDEDDEGAVVASVKDEVPDSPTAKAAEEAEAVPPEPEVTLDPELQRQIEEAEAAAERERQEVEAQNARLAKEAEEAEKEQEDALQQREREIAEQESANRRAEEEEEKEIDGIIGEDGVDVSDMVADAERKHNEALAEAEEERRAAEESAAKEKAAVEQELQATEAELLEAKASEKQALEQEAEKTLKEKQLEEEAAEKAAQAEAEKADKAVAEAEKEQGGGGAAGKLMGGLKAGLSAVTDKLGPAKEAAAKAKAAAQARLEEERKKLAEKHKDKLDAINAKKAEIEAAMEAKINALKAEHAAKIEAVEAKKRQATELAEEKKKASAEAFENRKREIQELAMKGKEELMLKRDILKERHAKARDERQSLLTGMKEAMERKKREMQEELENKKAEIARRKKEVEEAVRNRDQLVADLKAKAQMQLEEAKQRAKDQAAAAALKAKELKDKAIEMKNKAMDMVVGGDKAMDHSKKDLEVFIHNLKKVSLSSIRPAVAGALADLQGMKKEAEANSELMADGEEAELVDIQGDIQEARGELGVGAIQGILKILLKRIKALLGKGSDGSKVDDEQAQEVVQQLEVVTDAMVNLSTQLKDQVVDGVAQLRNLLDGDIPEIGSLVFSVKNIKGMIVKGHTLGKVVGNAYKSMDEAINFEAATTLAEAGRDGKDKAVARVREFREGEPPEVRNCTFLFKCNERKMHWEKVLNREILVLTEKVARSLDEGNEWSSMGEKKPKKSIWDACMIKKNESIDGPPHLVNLIKSTPGQLAGGMTSFLKAVADMTKEIEGLLIAGWKDVKDAFVRLVAAVQSGIETRISVALKKLLHSGQRLGAAREAAEYLIELVVFGLSSAEEPIDKDARLYRFEVSRAQTKLLRRQMKEELGLRRASLVAGDMQTHLQRALKQKQDHEVEMNEPSAKSPPVSKDEKKDKKKKKKRGYENEGAYKATAALKELTVGYIHKLVDGMTGTTGFGLETIQLQMDSVQDERARHVVRTVTDEMLFRQSIEHEKYEILDLDRMHSKVINSISLRQAPDPEQSKTHEEELVDVAKAYADGDPEGKGEGFRTRMRLITEMVDKAFERSMGSLRLTFEKSNIDVLVFGGETMQLFETISLYSHFRAQMARHSVGLEMALWQRKEKAGYLDIPMWKERDQAQRREFINHLREDFLNSAFGQKLMAAKEMVGKGLAKASELFSKAASKVDEQLGVTAKVEEMREKMEEVRQQAQVELQKMREATEAFIESNPEVKAKLDVIKKKNELFNDQDYERETKMLRDAIETEVLSASKERMKAHIAKFIEVAKPIIDNTTPALIRSERHNAMVDYLEGLVETLDNEVLDLVEMETCIVEFTQAVRDQTTFAELKLRDSRQASAAQRCLQDLRNIAHRGALSVKDITSICLEILQGYWEDSTATDKSGKRRSTIAADDLSGLDQGEDGRVLYLRTLLLYRISLASREFYRVVKLGCTRLQKLVTATKNVERTYFFHSRRLRKQLQALVGDVVFEMQQRQQVDWNASATYHLANTIESCLMATKERAQSFQCALDGDKVLEVGKSKEVDVATIAAMDEGGMDPNVAARMVTIMNSIRTFSIGVTLVMSNQATMAQQLATLKAVSSRLGDQVSVFDPRPALQKCLQVLKPARNLLSPDPAIPAGGCPWPSFFQGILGGFKSSEAREHDKPVKVKAERPQLPVIPLDPNALPVPILLDKAALLALRASMYFGLLMERFIAMIIESIKIFFNIIMMQAALTSVEIGSDLPQLDEIKDALKDIPLFGLISDVAQVFSDLFFLTSPFQGLEYWNCGGAVKALTPAFLLFGFFVVVLVLKKDLLLTLSVGILRLKVDASDFRKWVVSRIGKLLGILVLYITQFIVVTAVSLLFGDIMQSRRSCSDFDRVVQDSGLGIGWVGLWTLSLLYLSFFVFVGEPVDPPASWRIGGTDEERGESGWDTYQKRHTLLAVLVFFVWSLVSGVRRLVKQTLGIWDMEVVNAHRIVSRADAFDDDPNDDDNRHEMLVVMLGKANSLFWLFWPGVGPSLAKLQESLNDPVLADIDPRIDTEGLNILTPRTRRALRWIGSVAKYASTLCVVLTATEWSALFVGCSLFGDFLLGLIKDLMDTNETIKALTTPPS